MKFKNKYNISKEFEDIFTFDSEEDEIMHDAQMLMYKFLEEIEKSYANGPKFKKKYLADALGKSQSFISQLYSGDKLISFPLLAKVQKAFNISFDIKVNPNTVDYNESAERVSIPKSYDEPDGYWIWKTKKPDYSKFDDCCTPDDSTDTNLIAV